MRYDIVIRNGSIVDGSGMPAFLADVAIKDGRIAGIGRYNGQAAKTIDAEGMVVAPGFIDAHTHMDAQVFWDPLGTGSCWHGVTSVVMGNCGVTLAPCRPEDREYLMTSLEAVEDIPADVMRAGLPWRWESYADYLSCIDAAPKGINYAGYVGHSALRRYAMGERAATEKAGPEDIQAMRRSLTEAVRAGAMGFSTSRNNIHVSADGRPMPSRIADWTEVEAMVEVLGELSAGVFEMAGPGNDGVEALIELAVRTRVPVAFGLIFPGTGATGVRPRLELIERATARGARLVGQSHTRPIGTLWSFKSRLPYDALPVWEEIRSLPLDAQRERLMDPQTRARLVDIATNAEPRKVRFAAEPKIPRPDQYDTVRALMTPLGPNPSLADLSARTGKPPVEILIDLALERNFDQFFIHEGSNRDDQETLLGLLHPNSVVTFSDSGAHVSQIVDCALQSHLLAYWVREKQALSIEAAVRKMTFDIARTWGLNGRGLLAAGAAADVVVFDPREIGPTLPELVADLPAGGVRLVQRSRGICASIVNGVRILGENNRHTGDLPGQVLRGPLACETAAV